MNKLRKGDFMDVSLKTNVAPPPGHTMLLPVYAHTFLWPSPSPLSNGEGKGGISFYSKVKFVQNILSNIVVLNFRMLNSF